MNFKIIKIAIITALFSGGIIGCKKDESTGATNKVPSILITPDIQTSLSNPKLVFQNETLVLQPVVSQPADDRKVDMEYIWLTYSLARTGEPRREAARTATLNLFIKPELFIMGQSYLVRLEAKDKETGVSAFYNYYISVGNKFSGAGLMVLSEKNNVGDISFVFQNKTVEHHMYTSINSLGITKPKKLEVTTFTISDETSSAKRIYVLAENGSQEIDFQSMRTKYSYANLFWTPPTVNQPAIMKWLGNSGQSYGIFIGDGKVNFNFSGAFPGPKKWGVTLLSPDDNFNYDLAPFAIGGTSVSAMVYDNLSKKFLLVPSNGSKLQNFPSTASDPTIFSLNNVGMTMLHIDSASTAQDYFAIMKGADNLPYRLKVKTLNTSASNPNLAVEKVAMNAPGILNLSAAANSTTAAYIYYGVDNGLRTYSIGTNSVTETYSFPVNEKITAMRFSKSVLQDGVRGPRLAVATWDGSEGRVYFFKLNAFGATGEFTDRLTGFGKVVDMAIKF